MLAVWANVLPGWQMCSWDGVIYVMLHACGNMLPVCVVTHSLSGVICCLCVVTCSPGGIIMLPVCGNMFSQWDNYVACVW